MFLLSVCVRWHLQSRAERVSDPRAGRGWVLRCGGPCHANKNRNHHPGHQVWTVYSFEFISITLHAYNMHLKALTWINLSIKCNDFIRLSLQDPERSGRERPPHSWTDCRRSETIRVPWRQCGGEISAKQRCKWGPN